MRRLMRTRVVRTALLGVFLSATVAIGSGVASAVSIGPDCATCFGVSYSLTWAEVDASTRNYTFTVDATGYNGPGSGLDAVAVKTVSGSTDFSLSNQVAPGTFSNFDGGNLSANGCGSTGSGWICSFSSNTGGVPVGNAGDIYEWTFTQTITSGGFQPDHDIGVNALFVHADGKQAGLTSEKFAVPIPGTFLFFGIGFLAFVVWQLRQEQRRPQALGMVHA